MKNENIDFQQDEPNLMHNLTQLNEVIVRIYISLGKLKNVKIEKEGIFIKKFYVDDNLLMVDYDIMELIHILRSNYYPLSGTLEFEFHMVKSDLIYAPNSILSYLGFLKRLENNLPKEHAFVLSEIFPDQIHKVKFIEYKLYGMFQSIDPDVTVDKEFKLNINREAAFIKKTDPVIEKITKASNKKFAQYFSSYYSLDIEKYRKISSSIENKNLSELSSNLESIDLKNSRILGLIFQTIYDPNFLDNEQFEDNYYHPSSMEVFREKSLEEIKLILIKFYDLVQSLTDEEDFEPLDLLKKVV